MKIDIQLDGVKMSLDISTGDGKPRFVIDGRPLEVDAVQISPGTFSILIAGQSFEARVENHGALLSVTLAGGEYKAEIRDPRRLHYRRGGAIASEGRQQVAAPMPGKVIRVLAAIGDKVEANTGLVVIEAMKMQNEVRAPKSGIVERILVAQGQAVNAGDVLAVIA